MKRKRNHDKPSFTWIDGEEVGEIEPTAEPAPMFYVGDEVILYSPYTAEFYTKEYGFAPELYVVTEVRYDEEEEVFRYLLKGQLPYEWYSEDWISLPVETAMIRDITRDITRDIGKAPKPAGDTTTGATAEVTEAERAILAKWLDGLSREQTIDRCLDVLKSGNEPEKAEARRLLAEITGITDK